ncbi:hypothetical protein DFJ58DRAFT_850584 [Suillus subalutaceus]|uniref:uncharacterized protein n=1 Tax=Suillus subalutaceus TaxID=48586 RepID=UPI001B85B632|nr:uncharacterized protein DFJ58DRAFT_850584 [Suillus subalutaceus]KAG1814795.1 hypothetical protein DFJ58DRAFT_850584 [Suillus subalutaceus]
MQRGVNWLAGIEASMEVQQATETANRAKPVKPQARPVKKKESMKESMQGATSELTSKNHPVQAVVQDAGGHHTANSTGVGAGNGKAIGNEEFENQGRKTKRKKKANPTISCEASTLRFMNLTWGLRNKKYGLLGKVHNCIPTATVSTISLGISSARTGQTVATTVSLAKDPPPSLTDSSRTSDIPASDEDGDVNVDIDIDVDADNNEDNEEFKEHLSSLIANEKGREGVQVQSTHTISSTKRPIEAVDLIDPADDSMILDTSDLMTPEVEPIPTELARITSKTSITVCENLNPPKKAKLEPASQITSILASPEPDLMFADMLMKPKSAQPNFWSIEADKLLPVLQAIFDIAYPGMNHNVQPKGPIIGLSSLMKGESAHLLLAQ